jgi:hypothetical protein
MRKLKVLNPKDRVNLVIADVTASPTEERALPCIVVDLSFVSRGGVTTYHQYCYDKQSRRDAHRYLSNLVNVLTEALNEFEALEDTHFSADK